MQVLLSAILAWFLAQLIKVLITAIKYRKMTLYTLVSSGGMPSSHTALVVSLTTSVAMVEGMDSILFAVCLAFSLVVMYDAAGVRRVVGEQGKKLSKLLDDFYEKDSIDNRQFSQRIGKILGHTPLEVLAGLVLGIATAFAVAVFW